MTVYELYQNLQKFVAKIEFAKDYNNILKDRQEEIYSNSFSEDESGRNDWTQGYYIGRIEENLACSIDERKLWRQLFDIVKSFIESVNKADDADNITQDICNKLELLKKQVLAFCEPVNVPVPYSPVKEVAPHRYKIVEDKAEREKTRQQNSRYQIQSQYKEDSELVLKRIRYILRNCERELGIKAEKSDSYQEEFEELFEPEIKHTQSEKIPINLEKLNEGKSKQLLKNLIRFPDGVTYDSDKYGKQPDGIKDILKRNGYEKAAKAIHKRADKIQLEENTVFIKKNNPV